MFTATLGSSSPKLELVKEQPELGGGDMPPHPTRLSPSFKSDAAEMGLTTMDKDGHARLSWKSYAVIAAIVVTLVVSNWISHSFGVSEGQVAGHATGITEGIAVGREQREKEFILKSIDQMNNIKTALNMNFPDSKQSETKEKK